MIDTNQRFFSYGKKYFLHGLWGIGLLFLVVSLVTYNSADPSLCRGYSTRIEISNWGGWCGAWISALLFHLFGIVAWLILPACIDCAIKVVKGQLGLVVAVHAVTWIVALMSCAVLAIWCSSDPTIVGELGGAVGIRVMQLLAAHCSVVAAVFSLVVLLISSLFFIGQYYCSTTVGESMRQLGGYFLRRHTQQDESVYATDVARDALEAVNEEEIDDDSSFVFEMAVEHEDYDNEDSFDDDLLTTITDNDKPSVDLFTSAVCQSQAFNAFEVAGDNRPYTITPLAMVHGSETISEESEKKNQWRAALLKEKLQHFGVHGTVVTITAGPVITLFEYQPDIDSKISKILSLTDDLALALQALSIRIIAPIPGKSVVGFEVANEQRSEVLFADMMHSNVYQKSTAKIPILVGVDTTGKPLVVDAAAMPHLLVAGSTGSGKSVGLHGMITSMIAARSPQQLQLILIDPKRLEFSLYAGIGHLVFPIVTTTRESIIVLQWVVDEMERRYDLMAKHGVRTVADYNSAMIAKGLSDSISYLVVVIDELADLMVTSGREVEESILRITQKARAAGIHMIVATQRPSVDVITGVIKVNFPSRIAFRVTSKIDSRTIIDTSGAELLLGKGDMLFMNGTNGSIRRYHGAYLADCDIQIITDTIRLQWPAEYQSLPEEQDKETPDCDVHDEQLYSQMLPFVKSCDEVSISLVQRRFRIGYNRAARLIDLFEARGVISPSQGGKMRKVIEQ